jgi:hypothetical protein
MAGPNCKGIRCGGCGRAVHGGTCDPEALMAMQAAADSIMAMHPKALPPTTEEKARAARILGPFMVATDATTRGGCATLWANGRHDAVTCGHHHPQCCRTKGCHDTCSHLCDTEDCLCRDICNPLSR